MKYARMQLNYLFNLNYLFSKTLYFQEMWSWIIDSVSLSFIPDMYKQESSWFIVLEEFSIPRNMQSWTWIMYSEEICKNVAEFVVLSG